MHPHVLGVLAYPAAQGLGIVLATVLIIYTAGTAGLPVRRILAAWGVVVSAALAAAIMSASSFPPNGGLRYPAVGIAAVLALPLAVLVLAGRVPVLAAADVLAAPLAFGMGVAKTACFFHGCCHGPRSTLPWAVAFPPRTTAWFDHVDAGLIGQGALQSLPVHPLQLYLAAWSVAVGVVLLHAARRKRYDGQLVLLLLSLLMGGWYVHEVVKVQQNPPMRLATLVVALLATGALVARAIYEQRKKPSSFFHLPHQRSSEIT